MLVPDYHLHGQFSKDSTALLSDYCYYASKTGIREIAITEHFTLYREDKNYSGFDYQAFIEEVERCRLLFKGKLVIKAGIEVDYHPYLEQEIRKEIAKWNQLDLVIGSVHYVGGKSTLKSKLKREEEKPFVEDYFLIMEQMIRSGIFDVIGHFDVFRRSLNEGFEIEPYLATVERMMYKAANKNIALEINTSGFKHGLNDLFPNGKIVEIFKNCGGIHITIGSDAHHIEELAAMQEKGIAAAKLAGFLQISCFARRQPYLVTF